MESLPNIPPRPERGDIILPGFRAKDAAPERPPKAPEIGDLGSTTSGTYATRKRKSLMQPQDLAERLLPAEDFRRLQRFATEGCPTNCGPDWTEEVIQAARKAGPHVSACTPENVELIWDDIGYQEEAGFVRVIPESQLFPEGEPPPKRLKISRAAVVPQVNRRGRIILNLSAEVDLGVRRATGRRRWKRLSHPSVNDTTQDAAEQEAVKALGTAVASMLLFMFDTNSAWEIDWDKIDLSDGFWRMIVEAGEEFNFVFQLPLRKGDKVRWYVVPASLQMGWKNSPAFFCTGTEATRELIRRLLALTAATGINAPHRHEHHCLTPEPDTAPHHTDQAGWAGLGSSTIMCRVFVDDFCQGLAGDPNRPERRQQQLWLGRAAMHAIHAVFPPPDVLNHTGGKDSISEKKLRKGDACFKTSEVLLGFQMTGGQGKDRVVGIPPDKYDRYSARLRKALEQPACWIGFAEFQRIHGQMQHVSLAVPCLRGLMTPMNQLLKKPGSRVGLRQGGTIRATFELFATLLEDAQDHPSHITEIVGPDLPHVYGTMDASGLGAGGVWLPCTHWLQPVVWRVEWPQDIQRAVRQGTLTMVDCEFAAYFIGECMLDDLYQGPVAGLSSFAITDNSPTEGIVLRQASRASSTMPSACLRWLALRQRWTKRGPQDIKHWAGEKNLMADIPSRSFTAGFPTGEEDTFLTFFRQRFPLPSQLGSWTFAHPRTAIISAAISLLRKELTQPVLATTTLGSYGVGLPQKLAMTLSSPVSRTTRGPTTWGESTCSWPLLLPCGTVSSTMGTILQARRSRSSYSRSPKSWSTTELETLEKAIRPSSTSI